MKTIAFFNNKSGIGKTSLVYHLAWMFAERGVSVLAVDLDPQANLTEMFLEEDILETIWLKSNDHSQSIFGAVLPILRGLGDIVPPSVYEVHDHLRLLPGDLRLSYFENRLSEAWFQGFSADETALRTTTAIHRIIKAAGGNETELALIDIGPNLGAINRSALIASEYICLPLAPDIFSLQTLENLGPVLRLWRAAWNAFTKSDPLNLSLPSASMIPMGYIMMRQGIQGRHPVRFDKRWTDIIPAAYRICLLEGDGPSERPDMSNDPYCLAQLKSYWSLMSLAMEAHKPMFHLKPADGAIGAHVEAVRDCYDDFLALARRIGALVDITVP